MATKIFVRRPRVPLPTPPDEELLLEPPPEMPRTAPTNPLTLLMPAVMIAMVVGFIVVGGLNAASLMMGMMMLATTVGMASQSGNGQENKAQIETNRNDYLAYLERVRDEVQNVRREQRDAVLVHHPAPTNLSSFIGSARMWERRPHDFDYSQVRIGVGPQALSRPLSAPQTGPIEELDPVAALALQGLVKTYASVDDVPVAVRLERFSTVEILGDPERTRALVRALLISAATFHGPDTLGVAAVVSREGRHEWDWLKWLPHNQSQTLTDSLGPARMVASSTSELDELLASETSARARFNGQTYTSGRHLLIIVDSDIDTTTSRVLSGGLEGVTVLDLAEATNQLDVAYLLGLVVEGERLSVLDDSDVMRPIGRADALSRREAEALARAIAPYRAPEPTDDGTEVSPDAIVPMAFTDILNIGDATALTPETAWRPRAERDLLNVPIGVGPSGELVKVDIKESALAGMGPHGLVIGATGSGKSELLRTLVLALATTHSPEQLNLVLIDFKGGATFAGLGALPHTAAVITNLEDDLTMVDRMYDSLSGEMNRRQELLRDAGNVVNIREYARARANMPPSDALPVLPSLFIVCDEFSELLAQKPDFAELFAAIGRLGRSLGIHLLLASQRLEESKLRGLDSHLSYRIGLKTFSAQESRTVLGVPDAYHLPASPGAGYLKFDTTMMVRFKASYVSGPYQPPRHETLTRGVGRSIMDIYHRPISFVSDVVDVPIPASEVAPVVEVVEDRPSAAELANMPTLLETIVSRLEGRGTPAHAVWLPPLEISPTLDDLMGGVVTSESRGLQGRVFGGGTLRFPVGIVDLPYEQRRDPYIVDLSGGAGHAVVVGGPQSGKSTTLRTMISALALTHTPQEVQIYVVDLGGGSLIGTGLLPHVGGVATRSNRDLLRRMIAEVWGVLLEREVRFAELGVESMAAYRRMRAEGRVTDDPFGDVFLVIDGWGAFREDFEDFEQRVIQLAARGLSYGIHILLGVSRWMEMKPAIKDAILTRIELRLGDPGESDISRKIAVNVPAAQPGRGLTNPAGKHMLVGLPRIDGSGDPLTLTEGFDAFAREVNSAWGGGRAPAVRMLPSRIPLSEVPQIANPQILPLGINEDALAPVGLDVLAEPFFVYFADGEQGKSNVLKVLARDVMNKYSSDEARILVVDYRRALLDVVPPEYLAGYATGQRQAGDFLTDLVLLLEDRLPPADVTAQQLKDRSWWQGRELFVFVDDYDLVTGMPDNPITRLVPLLPQARDIGLHVVITRRASGASTAMFDPVLGAIRNLAGTFFVGNGPFEEGALVPGARPSPSYGPGRGWLVDRRHGARLVQIAVDE